MAKTKQQKIREVEQLAEKFSKMKTAVFANFDKLSVKDTEELRRLCREAGIDYVVAKKTLLRLALAKSGLPEVNNEKIEGSLATAISYEDEVAPAKILNDFAKKHEALKLAGGIFESRFIDLVKVKELAAIPSKLELLAKLVGSLNNSLVGLVRVLQGNLGGLVRVLNSIKNNK
ncbi:MAG: 50S ribosomal protein L10 [bacterium]